jgi:hypothetical protein
MLNIFKKKHTTAPTQSDLHAHTIAAAAAVQAVMHSTYPNLKVVVTPKLNTRTGEAAIILSSTRTEYIRRIDTDTPANIMRETIKHFSGSQYDPTTRFHIHPAPGVDTNLASLSYPDGTAEYTAHWEVVELGPITVNRVEE